MLHTVPFNCFEIHWVFTGSELLTQVPFSQDNELLKKIPLVSPIHKSLCAFLRRAAFYPVNRSLISNEVCQTLIELDVIFQPDILMKNFMDYQTSQLMIFPINKRV
tara:strand:- start:50 stop:367 length:318 start_codon:yes stop_codon:yes gene_type:complete